MCGRFTLTASAQDISEYFEVSANFEHTPQYNIAPSENILIVRENEHHQREASFARWGLIPHWSKEEDISSKWINARAETAYEKLIFKESFKYKRCLIVASGFYEWTKAKTKQPYYIHKTTNKPIGFAGFWERWENKEGKIIESCTILTTEANALLKPIHNRMPAILFQPQFSTWLNPKISSPEKLNALLQPYAATDLESYPVSTLVNSPMHDTPKCIEPLVNSEEK